MKKFIHEPDFRSIINLFAKNQGGKLKKTLYGIILGLFWT